MGEACHPGPSFLNFGRVRFPRSSGSRFEPLTQLDTQEVVPTTVVDAVDEVNQAIEEDQVFSRVAQSDTETVPSVGDSSEDSDDGGHSDVENMQHPILGEVAAGFEEILASPATRAAFSSLDAVDLMEIFTKRARVLKSPPAFLKGAFRSCMRFTTRSGVSVRGNCSFSSHDWCCIVHLGEAHSPRRHCRSGFIGSRGESGCNCWQQVRRCSGVPCARQSEDPFQSIKSLLSEELSAPRCWQI